MNRYRGNPDAIRALVREDEVHRDVYTDPELFALEQEHLFRNTWIYLGHDSQVPKPGDFYTADIAGRPLLMLRGGDGVLRVLYNRCAHKGAKIVNAVTGNTGTVLRCPYHGWTYRADGGVRTIPLKGGYEGTRFDACQASVRHGGRRQRGELSRLRLRAARRAGHGFSRLLRRFTDLDRQHGRSLAGGQARSGRWRAALSAQLQLEDVHREPQRRDAPDGRARVLGRHGQESLWSSQPPDAPKPMVIEQFVPFVSGYDFFDNMGVKIYDNGHSYTGVNFSIHSKYSAVPAYEAAMIASYGAERAHAILAEARHNTVYYPSLTIKGAIQAIRVARPLAVDRTVRRELDVPSRRRARGTPAAHADVFAADQCADVRRRSRRSALLPSHPGRACGGWQRMGQPAPQFLGRRAAIDRGRVHGDQRGLDAGPVPRLGALHGRRRCSGWCGMTTTAITPDAIREFVYREARLIDEKRFAEWYDLFTEDARYWIPLTRNQTDGVNHTSADVRRQAAPQECASNA